MIDHIVRVKEKLKLLEVLRDIQTAQSLLIGQEEELKLYHPIDVQYGLLSCQV